MSNEALVFKGFSDSTIALGEAALRSDNNTRNKWLVFGDALVSDGTTVAELKISTTAKPNPKANPVRQAELKAMVLRCQPASVQRLLAADVVTLSDAKKAERRTAQQRLGSDYKKVQKHVFALLLAREAGTAKKAAKKTTRCQRMRKQLAEMVDALQKWENPPAELQIPKAIKALETALAAIPASK